MTRPYSLAFKQKMVERLTGKNAVSALELSKETAGRQQNLSRWLQKVRSLPLFRTLKHTPAYRRLLFASVAVAQQWMARFVSGTAGSIGTVPSAT